MRIVTNFRPDPAMLAKTETLIEALPYLQRYAGAIFVVKYGGHAMGDDDAANRFAEDVALLKAVGINPVVVHGGGPQIGAMLTRLGVKSEFIGGLRVTDRATAEVAEMVLAGTINGELVDRINAAGGRAMGLSGKDARFVIARKVTRSVSDPGSAIERVIDLGFVGEPASVDRSVLDTMIRSGVIPVIAPIAPGDDGQTYNINADTMAGAVAVALGAARFFLLTDVPGVLNRDGNLLTDLSKPEVDGLIADGTISGGMIPKVETCVSAVASGVGAAVIIDGRVPHGMLLEVFTRQGAGTLFRA
jgi:acetylglutamate kinase